MVVVFPWTDAGSAPDALSSSTKNGKSFMRKALEANAVWRAGISRIAA